MTTTHDITWTPSIGDPSIFGWTTVVLYFVAAFSCFRALKQLKNHIPRQEQYFLFGLFLLLILLGLNKQLDLQTLLTQTLKTVAINGGWYEERRAIQKSFILGSMIIGMLACVSLMIVMRHSIKRFLPSIIGICLICVYVVIRASSFHHVDLIIHSTLFGVTANFLFESIGILLILANTLWISKRPFKSE